MQIKLSFSTNPFKPACKQLAKDYFGLMVFYTKSLLMVQLRARNGGLFQKSARANAS